MSRTITLHLDDQQAEKLERTAHRRGRSTSEIVSTFIDEGLRVAERDDFSLIEHRDTPVGRLAYVKNSRLTVAWVVRTNEGYNGDIEATIQHVVLPPEAVRAALEYAATYPEELAEAMEKQHRSLEELQQLIPHLEVRTIDSSAP